MRNFYALASIILITCMIGLSCKKDSQQQSLPPATTTGASTMGFLVDGKPWVAHSDDFKLSKTGASFWTDFGVEIYGVNHPASRLEMTLKHPKTGKYQFTTDDALRYILYSNSPPFLLDLKDAANSLKITHYDGKIISGTFSFNLKSSDGSTASITSGRFDIPIK